MWNVLVAALACGGAIGAAAITTYGARRPPPAPTMCLAVIERVERLALLDPQLAHLYFRRHGRGLPRLVTTGWTRECGESPLSLLTTRR